MTSPNSFDDEKPLDKESGGIRERMPTATLHYGSPNHDFMYSRPSLPFMPPAGPLSAAERHNPQSPLGLRMSIYTCERCMHGFTHASDFLHHKAICMGDISNPEAEAKLRESVQAKVEKIIDTDNDKDALKEAPNESQDIDFQNIAKSVNVIRPSLSLPSRSQLSPGVSASLGGNKSPKSPGVSMKKFGCRYCDKEFPAMYIQNHELTHLLDSPEKPYSCAYCGRAFANLPACQNHERIHTEPRPYICEICSKGFMTAGILKTHMLTHSGLKRFQCQTCTKAFTTAGNLKTHENIHKGEKPFACSQCGKCFTTAGNLKTHEKIHIGLKPFTCEVCLKSFTTAGNLKTHENIHTGNKPFECDQCHKAFTTAGNLKTHYRLHTGERPYVCNICTQAYHSSANLRSHQKAQHGIDNGSDQGSLSPRGLSPRGPRPIFSPPPPLNPSSLTSHSATHRHKPPSGHNNNGDLDRRESFPFNPPSSSNISSSHFNAYSLPKSPISSRSSAYSFSKTSDSTPSSSGLTSPRPYMSYPLSLPSQTGLNASIPSSCASSQLHSTLSHPSNPFSRYFPLSRPSTTSMPHNSIGSSLSDIGGHNSSTSSALLPLNHFSSSSQSHHPFSPPPPHFHHGSPKSSADILTNPPSVRSEDNNDGQEKQQKSFESPPSIALSDIKPAATQDSSNTFPPEFNPHILSQEQPRLAPQQSLEQSRLAPQQSLEQSRLAPPSLEHSRLAPQSLEPAHNFEQSNADFFNL